MTVEKIKKALQKKATIFKTSGIKPTNALLVSWIGRVGFKLEDETSPIDKDSNAMTPLAMFFLKDLPSIPTQLEGIELITVFMSTNIFYDFKRDIDYLSSQFIIRKYSTLDNLIPCDLNATIMTPFPLSPSLIENDFPVLDGDDIPSDIFDIICELEDGGEMDYHNDIVDKLYPQHKIGGYATYCQSGITILDAGYEFVMQISSDDKAKFNIIDNGLFFFYYNKDKNDWKVYCDFY